MSCYTPTTTRNSPTPRVSDCRRCRATSQACPRQGFEPCDTFYGKDQVRASRHTLAARRWSSPSADGGAPPAGFADPTAELLAGLAHPVGPAKGDQISLCPPKWLFPPPEVGRHVTCVIRCGLPCGRGGRDTRTRRGPMYARRTPQTLTCDAPVQRRSRCGGRREPRAWRGSDSYRQARAQSRRARCRRVARRQQR